MILNIIYCKIFNFFFFFWGGVLCVKCINLKLNGQLKSLLFSKQTSNNPWKDELKKYDVISVHGGKSGVYVDLGGVLLNEYHYPIGQCPVYNKIIELGNNHSFLDRVPVEFNFADSVAGFFHVSGIPEGGFNIPNNFRVKSPTYQKTLLDCSKLALRFRNCKQISPPKNCVNMPFAYDMKNSLCYLLFFTSQLKNNYCGQPNEMYCYRPVKNLNSLNMVYGSSFIRSDWESACPYKPIKGGHFGIWEKDSCVNYFTESYDANTPSDCGIILFNKSAQNALRNNEFQLQTNYNHANWVNKKCYLLPRAPDCFISAETGFAFTSLGSVDEKIADFPPCNSLSEGWVQCDYKYANSVTQCKGKNLHQCVNGEWIYASDGIISVKSNKLIIICSAMGASLLVILLGAGGFYYFKRKTLNTNDQDQNNSVFLNDQNKKRLSDDVVDTDLSFWKGDNPDETQVIIEKEY